MIERRNVLEIMIVKCELLRRSQTRINLLFTMSEITHAESCEGRDVRSDVSRTMFLACNGQPVFALSSYDAAAFATTRLAEP